MKHRYVELLTGGTLWDFITYVNRVSGISSLFALGHCFGIVCDIAVRENGSEND